LNGEVIEWNNESVDADGNPDHLVSSTAGRSAIYSPAAGQRYFWLTGENFTDFETFHEEDSTPTFFDLFPLDWLLGDDYDYSNPTSQESVEGKSIPEGEYLEDMGSGTYEGYEFNRESYDKSGWHYGEWEEWDKCTKTFIWCVERTYYAEQTRWKGKKKVYTHSVGADHDIDIKFIGHDKGQIDVASDG